jgi:hypothetical protein
LLREEYLYLSMPGNRGLLDSTLDSVDAEFSYLSERKMKHYLNVSNFSNIQVAYTYSEAHLVECKVAFANPIIYLVDKDNKLTSLEAAREFYKSIEKEYSPKGEERYRTLTNWVNEKHLYEKEPLTFENVEYPSYHETMNKGGIFNYTVLKWTFNVHLLSLGLMKQFSERLITAIQEYEIDFNLAVEEALMRLPSPEIKKK